MRRCGADHVIDYTQEDFTNRAEGYDLIFDCVGNHSLSALKRALHPQGICVMVGDPTGRGATGIVTRLITALGLSWFGGQKFITFLARPRGDDLTFIADLMKAGKVMPVVDRCYSLSEVPEAVRYLETKHARGKAVITLP